MLKELFEEIKEKKKYFAQAVNGAQFEQNLRNKLIKHGFREIVQKTRTETAISQICDLESMELSLVKQKWKEIKKQILKKNSIQIVLNPFQKLKNTFIFQPYGSQQFPDFLIFTKKKYILPIEIKYSINDKKRTNLNKFKPMWNSNLPKANALYLYGVTGEGITFFKGDDILNFKTRQVLLDFFNNLDKRKQNLDNQLKDLKNNFGLYPYIRKAYDHKTKYSTYKNSEKKQMIEPYFWEKQKERERNVIYFLEKIDIEEEK